MTSRPSFPRSRAISQCSVVSWLRWLAQGKDMWASLDQSERDLELLQRQPNKKFRVREELAKGWGNSMGPRFHPQGHMVFWTSGERLETPSISGCGLEGHDPYRTTTQGPTTEPQAWMVTSTRSDPRAPWALLGSTLCHPTHTPTKNNHKIINHLSASAPRTKQEPSLPAYLPRTPSVWIQLCLKPHLHWTSL